MQNKYNVIYADPPWNQKAGTNLSGGFKKINGQQVFNRRSSKSENLPYQTMSIQDIISLNVQSIVSKDAHLYMWVTNKYLMEANQIIKAWGFKYSTCLTWSKKPMGGGLGGTFRVTHEHLLFCTRGSLKAKQNITGTVFNVKREYVNGAPCHSRKPSFFSSLIESVSPGPYLELFAREQRQGWDVFGNEVEHSIIIN